MCWLFDIRTNSRHFQNEICFSHSSHLSLHLKRLCAITYITTSRWFMAKSWGKKLDRYLVKKGGREREKSYCFPLSTFRITPCHFSSSSPTPMLKGRQWVNIFLFLREVPSVFIGNFHTFPSDKRNCEDLLWKLTTYENSHFITPSKCDIILRHRTTIGMSTSRFNIFTTRKIGTRLKIDNLTRFE